MNRGQCLRARPVHGYRFIYITLLLSCLVRTDVLTAQSPVTLDRGSFVQLVLKNHPMARQAALRSDIGAASVRSARGGFDPVATIDHTSKTYGGTDYFDLLDAGLKVPTWYGVELMAGFQDNEGAYLDPQNTTPPDGLVKAGAEVSIGQGLFIDQRRATLRKAQAYQRATEGERREMLNALLLEALNDHTDWVAAYEQMRVSDSAVVIARRRFDQVRGSFLGGDRPAIDTLEAYLQLQDRLMRLQQASLNSRNSTLRVSNHLWDDSQRPLEPGPDVVPLVSDLDSPGSFAMADSSIDRAVREHPKLLKAQAELDRFSVDARYQAEQLKPRLDLRYLWMGSATAANNEGGSTLLGEGHQVGVGFKMPLLLRKERGESSLAKLRYTDAELDLARERTVIRNKVLQRLNDIAVYRDQVDLGADMVANYARLLSGEVQRFIVGESSLFLVNGREVPLLGSRLKQVEYEAALRKAHFALDHDAGTLWQAWR